MSKAILVIDMPRSCMECEIINHEELTCMGMKVQFSNLNNRQVFCPLKPVPEKKDSDNALFYKDYFEGYNACIDDILGGTDNE